jgi:site-specific recombinase XerD
VGLLDEMRMVMRRRHYSRRTEEAYAGWIVRYARYHQLRHPAELSAQDVRAFLGHLAAERQCSASTQNQVLNALVFLYRHVLDRDLGEIGPFDRARRDAVTFPTSCPAARWTSCYAASLACLGW